MTTKIELFDQNALPFGALSNNAITPFYKDGALWKSVTHYIYANLLPPGYKHVMMSSQLRDIITKFREYKEKSLIQLTNNILENGVRTLVSENTQFRDLLLSTDNKKLIYITNSRLFNQEYPILGKTQDGEGANMLGEIYEKIRNEEKNKQFLKKDQEKNREKDEQIIKIIQLVKILQSEMLTKFDDLSSLFDKTFDSLYDKFRIQIHSTTHVERILLEQYHKGRLINGKLIHEIEEDPDNIVWYVRNYYADQFKLKLHTTRKRELVEYFLTEQLKKRHPQILDNQKTLEKELNAQMQEIYKKGAEFSNNFFENIVKLYDTGKLEVPIEISEKYTTNIDDQFDKKSTSHEISDTMSHEISDEHPESTTDTVQQDSELENVNQKIMNAEQINMTGQQTAHPELDLLKQIGQSDESKSMGYHSSDTVPVDMEHKETLNYILFTDGVGKFQQLSPYHTGRFSDGFQYTNLISYYYVKLIYSIGNMVKIRSNTITIPGGHNPPNLLMPMVKAHRFIMIPECHNIHVECDQFDIKNYITDFSQLPEQILEIENRNKVLLLEAALEGKFEKNSGLKALLLQNPSKTLDFQYAENSDPSKRFDEILGIGPDGRGKNFTGKILSKLRQKYLDEESATDELNKDIALLSHMFNKDSQLIGWFYSRAFDMLNTTLLVFLATTHMPNKGDHYEIGAEFVSTVKNYIYNTCNVSFNDFIELEVSEPFFIHVNDEFDQKFRRYTDLSVDDELPVKLSSGAIVEIWKYCCWLMYELLLESSRMKQKNNVKLFLTNIVLNMTENNANCPLQVSSDDSSLRNIKTCIVSSIINVLKSLILIYNGSVPLNLMMIGSIVNIITGKTVSINIKKSDEHSTIFENILPKYPTLYEYITNADNSDEIILILNYQYDYLERQSSDSFDVTELENQRIRNRINFFSSIPTRHPQSMIPGVDPTSSTSSTSSEVDQDLLAQLKVIADLGPVDINPKRVVSTQLKPAGRGLNRVPQYAPFYGAMIDRPGYTTEQTAKSSDHRTNILGSDAHKQLMSDLSDEFDDYVSSGESLIPEDINPVYQDVPGQFDDDE